MNLWLIIPVKPLNESKSRLAAVLSPEERATLIQALFTGVLRVSLSVDLLSGIIVVSRDQAVLQQARAAGALPLHEKEKGLNQALTQAARRSVDLGADAVLILPADLPLVTPQDIYQLYELNAMGNNTIEQSTIEQPTVEQSTIEPGIVIAPSRDGGTNALLLQPPRIIDFSFGLNSFQHHCSAAQEAGIRCQIAASSGFALDVDQPEDLAKWQALQQL